ncbi:hypothetical protein B0A48_13104 [Cryoendolithus antarcticus]|uniref:Mating-type protein MAT-1 n=1 Tax=Cryoendolithus antarcticus TaxID=1507870 RepID=A0A1V8SNG9_9PEZI|nr:hypothetical protein B0A48_13104 [Cryoendolithus antarcticus]
MATTSPLTTEAQALVNIFSTASEEHVEEIIKALKALPQLMKAKTEVTKMKTKHGLAAARSIKKPCVKRGKQEKATGGPKRPLNSWMAFRNYYNPVLAPNTQKARSKVLTEWWKADLFEGKWSMLAKGYSILRGNREKAEVPLQEFFARCAALIGVIPPTQYQRMMGWQLGPPAEHDESKVPTMTRIFVPTLESFPESITTTVLSVDDLVDHCIRTGLVQAPQSEVTSIQHGALTMAVQPTVATPVPQSTGSDYALAMALNNVLYPVDQGVTAVQQESTVRPTGEAHLQSATETLDTASSFPYAEAFHPANEYDLSFDPSSSDNTFDDGGVFDSFNVGGDFAIGMQNGMDFNFSDFLNDA